MAEPPRSRRPRGLRPRVLVWVLALATTAAGSRAAAAELLTEQVYPIEVSISFSAALFHWLDSIAGLQVAGTSAGKTVGAHRRIFEKVNGPPTKDDQRMIRRFGELRGRFADTAEDPSALLAAFLDAADLDGALAQAEELLSEADLRELRAILEHFAPKYRAVWDGGRIPKRFLSLATEQAGLQELERLLARIAAFFGVDPPGGAPPRLILMPVEDGYGTHAQAIGRHLLIELRWRDRLASAASVIVHENAHLLMQRMPGSLIETLESLVRESGAAGAEAARVLQEALPTALGQGVADRMFQPDQWSLRYPWYHTREVDLYAKRIYRAVAEAIANDGTFDEELLRRFIRLHNP